MKKTLMLKIVRQEVRRALKPTGLMGKRGPAKNVPVLVQKHVDAQPQKPCTAGCPNLGLGLSE